MARLIRRIFIFASIFSLACAKSARCLRNENVITCVNADRGVIDRLGSIYYRKDVALIVKDSNLNILETGMFRNLTSLEKLSLETSGVTFIQDQVFRGLNLTHLNLTRNSIRNISTSIFLDLWSLKFLDLSHNAITRLELSSSIEYLPRLRHLDASNNRLKNVTLIGNFSQLKTINLENNLLSKFPIDEILHFPKLKRVFFSGNLFNESYESFLTFTLTSYNVEIDINNTFFYDGWNRGEIINEKTAVITGNESSPRSVRNDIEKDFKLSPETIRSLNHSQLVNLVDKILTLRNFTLTERRMIELDRKRILDQSRKVKNEYNRIDQIIKRYHEIFGEAREESVGEYIEKSCQGMPNDTWWRRFKKWKCKKLFNWIKRLVSR